MAVGSSTSRASSSFMYAPPHVSPSVSFTSY